MIGSPWWLAQLATGAKSFRDNPFIGSKRLNRLGLHVRRVDTAHQLATMRRRRLASRIPVMLRDAFDAQGFVCIEDFLPASDFAALRRGVLDHAAPTREMAQGDTITRRIAIDHDYAAHVPAIRALTGLPLWRDLLRYAGSFASEPLHYVQTILTHEVDAAADPQTALHADTFHPTVKAWYFLNDVAEDEAPFSYVPGSHRLTAQRRAWEYQRSIVGPAALDRLSARGSMRIGAHELLALGLPQPRLFGVRANTLVVADTCGFHARGPAARQTQRVEIWSYGRRNPFLPWAGLDPLSLPGIAQRRIGAMWALRDLFEPLIGQPWRSVGEKRPLDR